MKETRFRDGMLLEADVTDSATVAHVNALDTFKRSMRRCVRRARDMGLVGVAQDLASVRLSRDPFGAWACLITFGGMACSGDAARHARFLLSLVADAMARLRAGLAEEERKRDNRCPPPPDTFVGALQDRVHVDKGRLLTSVVIRLPDVPDAETK